MNTNLGLIGKKLGNTQIFTEDGEVRRVTAIQAGPCVVLGKRTAERDGYTALQLGFGQKRDKGVTKPARGQLKKWGVEAAPGVVQEFRLPAEVVDQFQVGQEIKASDVFTEGQFVDVSGTSKGRGFTGVMKRHNFKGSKSSSHGTHEYQRHGGSIGTNMTPGRTFKGLRMAGHYGAEKVTIQSIKIARVDDASGVVLIEGGVPGPKNGVVTLRSAVKKRKKTEA